LKDFFDISIVKHKIADMSKKQQNEGQAVAEVEVRNVAFDQETDSSIDVWRAKQKALGRRVKRGQAVVELTKKGLIAEGIR
jgi:hypothetical protein